MFTEDSYSRVLGNRNFLTLWFGQGLASLGQAILYVVVALYVYDLTGSAHDASLAVVLELLPWVVIGPNAGVIGPILGGMLVGVIGAKAVFLVIAAFMIISALSSLIARIPSQGTDSSQSLYLEMIKRDFFAAAKYLVANKVFRFQLLLNFVLAQGGLPSSGKFHVINESSM